MTDPQREVFIGASELDWSTATVVDHDDSTLADLDPEPARSREDYERDQWDAGREEPATVEEARAALAARIADPACPDTEDEAGAYDGNDDA